ncbi:MAG TPA: response regulator, partial [Flavobacterium sp.]|nr:response regulator [Flavobacterium sp.]
MTTAILIDDDANLRAGMRQLLSIYAPEINVLGEAESVQSGVEAINLLQPQVIFLDIQLSDGTGFDLLEKLAEMNGKISSQVVFITAHEQYAIKAFRFSALDFLLKPVDPEELQKVIYKIKNVLAKSDNYAHIDLLLENIRRKVDNFKRIALSTSDGIHL